VWQSTSTSIEEDSAQSSGELDSSSITDHQNDSKWQKHKQNPAVKKENKMREMPFYFIQKNKILIMDRI
jgi:hypothetical protein